MIVNLAAGGGRAGSRLPDVMQVLSAAGIDPTYMLTEGPGMAVDLAEAAARDGYDIVIPFGGDGTAHEVANGLLRVPDAPPLAPVQAGSGNAVADFLGFPRGSKAQAEFLLTARPQRIDVGWAEYQGFEGPERRAFLLLGSAGWSAAMIRRSVRYKRFAGGAYAIAMIAELRNLKAMPYHVTTDGVEERLPLIDFSIVNPPLGTGRMKMVPGADPTDGVLDSVKVMPPSWGGLLRTIGRLATRRQRGLPGMLFDQVREVRVEPDDPVPVQLDGEFVGHTPVTFRVEPQGLNVLAGTIATG